MSFIKKHKKAILTVYFLLGFLIFLQLYYGESFFYTTIYTYSLAAFIVYYTCRFFNISTNITIAACSLILALFAAEFTLRYIIRYPLTYGEQNEGIYILVDRYRIYENAWAKYIKGRHDVYTLEPDSAEIRDNDVGDYHYTNDTCNALGFRGKLPVGNKKIILVMGDSFTEGCGAPVDSSIPALLRSCITARDTGTDVINCGVSANDIFFDWMMLQKLARKYDVKQVVFDINSTDINDVATRGGNERFTGNGMLRYNPRPWWEPIFAVSYVFRLAIMNLTDYDYNLRRPAERQQINAAATQKIAELLRHDILPWAKTKTIGVTVLSFPVGAELHTPATEYKLLTEQLKSVDGCKVIDCLPKLQAQPFPKQLYWPNDLHYNSAGYSIIAGLLIDSCCANHN